MYTNKQVRTYVYSETKLKQKILLYTNKKCVVTPNKKHPLTEKNNLA